MSVKYVELVLSKKSYIKMCIVLKLKTYFNLFHNIIGFTDK